MLAAESLADCERDQKASDFEAVRAPPALIGQWFARQDELPTSGLPHAPLLHVNLAFAVATATNSGVCQSMYGSSKFDSISKKGKIMSKKGNDNPERIAVWWTFWYVRRRVARRIKFLVWEGTSRLRLQKLRKKKKKKTSRTLLLPPNSSHKICEKKCHENHGKYIFRCFFVPLFAAFESSDCLLDRASRRCCFEPLEQDQHPASAASATVDGEKPHRETHPSLGTTTPQNASTGSLKVRKRVGLSHWPRTCATALCLF
jgi:hypothetical protein